MLNKFTKIIPLTLALALVISPVYADDEDIFGELEQDLQSEESAKSLFTLHQDIYCAVDGKAIPITGCVMKEDRVYVPIKPIFEAMGFTVNYSAKLKQVGLMRGDSKILIDIGKGLIAGTLVANNKSVELNAVLDDSVDLSGAVYIPIRNIAENMYCVVDWNQDAQTVYIKSPDLSSVEVNTVTTDELHRYLGTSATEYYKNLFVILNPALISDNKDVIFTSLTEATKQSGTSTLELETIRVLKQFTSRMHELDTLDSKPTSDTGQEWDSNAFTPIDTYTASRIEAQRFSDRLYHEGMINNDGAKALQDMFGRLYTTVHG